MTVMNIMHAFARVCDSCGSFTMQQHRDTAIRH